MDITLDTRAQENGTWWFWGMLHGPCPSCRKRVLWHEPEERLTGAVSQRDVISAPRKTGRPTRVSRRRLGELTLSLQAHYAVSVKGNTLPTVWGGKTTMGTGDRF